MSKVGSMSNVARKDFDGQTSELRGQYMSIFQVVSKIHAIKIRREELFFCRQIPSMRLSTCSPRSCLKLKIGGYVVMQNEFQHNWQENSAPSDYSK